MDFRRDLELEGDIALRARSMIESAERSLPISNSGQSSLYTEIRSASFSGVVGGPFKRSIDVFISGAMLLAGLPFLMLVWAVVRIESKGPGLFFQLRGGLNGKPFWIIKFRTMTTCDTDTIIQAKKDDVRVTKLGRFLRKTSIDELPQLVNVLFGDMSIVGPRPHALQHDREFAEIDSRYGQRCAARPGITGLAQVSGCRGPTTSTEIVRQRIAFDITYVRKWSVWLDAKILARTLLMFFSGDNKAF